MKRDKKIVYDIYFASPFFNAEQVERERRLVSLLRSYELKVYAPSENGIIEKNASASKRQKIFADNIKAIKHSQRIFAVTDGKDVGTIWEAGYGYAKKKEVIYYAETINGPFNIMLAQSGIAVFSNMESLEAALRKGSFDTFEVKEFE